MKYIVFTLFALILTLGEAAASVGPGSYAYRAGPYGGPIRLQANFVAHDTCHAALTAYRGTPGGQFVGPDTIPATIVIGPNPHGCGYSPVVKRVMTLGGPRSVNLIQIFFVDPSGRLLKIERVQI